MSGVSQQAAAPRRVSATSGRRGGVRGTVSVDVVSGLCRVSDLVSMVIAATLSGWLLASVENTPPSGDIVVVSIISIIVVYQMFKHLDLYSLPVLLDPLAAFVGFAAGTVAGGVAAFGTLVLLHDRTTEPGFLLAQPLAWCLSSSATILALRSVAAWRLQRQAAEDRLTLKFAVVGATAISHAFLEEMAGNPALRVVGVYDDGFGRDEAVPPLPMRGSVADLVAYARTHALDAVVIALPSHAPERVAAVRQQLAGLAADIFLTSDIFSVAYPTARMTTFGDSPVLSLAPRPLRDWHGLQKAIFDRVVSAALLVLALPLLLLIAVLVKLSSPGPILFRQAREGLNGAPFTMFKFRTMVHDTATDQSVQATRHDPRVTRVGSWLRRTSLDELPQLLNVLRGDMSLVGPRPHYATTRAGNRLFSEVVPEYAARHRVKPGITGWAQVHGLRGETRTEQQIADRVAHDLYYIEHWSLWFDMQILLRTLMREIRSRSGNAY